MSVFSVFNNLLDDTEYANCSRVRGPAAGVFPYFPCPLLPPSQPPVSLLSDLQSPVSLSEKRSSVVWRAMSHLQGDFSLKRLLCEARVVSA